MKRRYVVVALGLVASLALISPAFGGPSIGKLVKDVRKLQKQVRVADKRARQGKLLAQRNQRSLEQFTLGGREALRGPRGEDGVAISARARLAAPASTAGSASVEFPLNGGSWTQAADEMNVIYGQIEFEQVGGCQSAGVFGSVPGYLFVDIGLDGKRVTRLGPVRESGTLNPSEIRVFDSGEPEAHALTLAARDSCGGSGRFNIASAAFNVISLR